MNVQHHDTVDELHRLYRAEPNARMARRIHGVWLARRGRTCPQIMDVTGAGRRSIQLWVAKYNAGGVDELLEKPRPGRPTFLNADQQKKLAKRVATGPRKKDIVSVFNASAIDELVEREFGVLYSLRGMQMLLHRLGFSYQCPRPRHENADAAVQAAFKKNSRERWLRSKSTTPASESTSTSKTKRDSGNKAH